MSGPAPSAGEDAARVRTIHGRLSRALRVNQELGVTGPLRAFALVDAPALVQVAYRGVEARQVLDAQAGLPIRAAAVRDLHGADEYEAGLIVCAYCTLLAVRPVVWPCDTAQAIDGLSAP